MPRRPGHYTSRSDYPRGIRSSRTEIKAIQMPRSYSEGNSVCFEQTEFVANINGVTTFQSLPLSVNPGNSNLFPMLSQLATSFESYSISELVFEYRPLISDQISSADNSLGFINMVVDYSAIAQPFTSKAQAFNYERGVTVRPCDPTFYKVDLKTSHNDLKRFYVRTEDPPANADLRLYDLGVFLLTLGDMQQTTLVGDLWIHYKVHFYKQKILDPVFSYPLLTGKWYSSGQTANPSTPNYFGTPLVNAVTDPLESLDATFTSNTITLPSVLSPGSTWILMIIYSTPSAGSWSGVVESLGSGLTQVDYFASNGGGSSVPQAEPYFGYTGSASQYIFGVAFSVNSYVPGQLYTITLSSGSFPANANTDIIIFPLPGSTSV